MIELRTARLRLRPVTADDLDAIAALGEDARVMEWLGGTMTRDETARWLDGVLEHWRAHGYGRFFIERDGAFVGVAGLSRNDLDAGIVPGIEIAWRLAFDHWGHGYATEAARACLDDAATRLGLRDVIAVTTVRNTRSRAVMERLGMVCSPSETFEHPKLPLGSPLRTHVVYRVPR